MQGFKTVALGAAMAILPGLTQYMGVIDWSFLGSVGALVASGVTMTVMRILTTTPVFTGKQ